MNFPTPAMLDPATDLASIINPLQDPTRDDWKSALQEAELYVLQWLGLKNPPSLQNWDPNGPALTDQTYEEIYVWQYAQYKVTYRAGWNRKNAQSGAVDSPYGIKAGIAKLALYLWKQNNLDNDPENVEAKSVMDQKRVIWPLISRYARRLPCALPDRYCLLRNFPVLHGSLSVTTQDRDGAFTVPYSTGRIDLEMGVVDLWECNNEFPEG